MIPKLIHYCWFGRNPIPKEYRKYMKSWKKHNPGYEIIRWDENNYDVTKNAYMHEAYKAKKWAFVSDYARLDIVYNHGGIYLDTDVEILKNLDDLLFNKAFIGIEQDNLQCNTGSGFGAIKGHETIRKLRDCYDNIRFLNEDGTYNLTTCTSLQTHWLSKHGFVRENQKQIVADITIYPWEYFSANSTSPTGQIRKTDRAYSIHHYGFSWIPEKDQLERKIIQRYTRFFGKKAGLKLYNASYIFRTAGIRGVCGKIKEQVKSKQGNSTI